MDAKECRALYEGPYQKDRATIDARIEEGIEQNRKGYARLRLLDAQGHPLAGKTVQVEQQTHDFQYGGNLFLLDELEKPEDNATYRAFFREHFNLATIPFYWDGLEPVEGQPRYARDSAKVYRRPAPDLCLDYCNESGIGGKLHCLVYDKFVPQWLKALPRDAVKARYEERVRQIAERYAGRLNEFEVINEQMYAGGWGDEATGLCEERHVCDWAFALAEKYLPHETLVINDAPDTSGELVKQGYVHPYYQLCEGLLARGARIDKIGLQNHQFTGVSAHTPQEYEASIRAGVHMLDPLRYFLGLDLMATLGRPLEITEVTIPTFGEGEEFEELQADMLRLLYRIWFSHPAVQTVVYWNTVEGYAYNGSPNWIENNCRGGLWHHDLTPKKAALALHELFHKTWHTSLTLHTDSDGYADFRGFFGEYTVTVEGQTTPLSLHRSHPASQTICVGEKKD